MHLWQLSMSTDSEYWEIVKNKMVYLGSVEQVLKIVLDISLWVLYSIIKRMRFWHQKILSLENNLGYLDWSDCDCQCWKILPIWQNDIQWTLLQERWDGVLSLRDSNTWWNN